MLLDLDERGYMGLEEYRGRRGELIVGRDRNREGPPRVDRDILILSGMRWPGIANQGDNFGSISTCRSCYETASGLASSNDDWWTMMKRDG